ncbi:MAG TPA: hypothetical protein VFV52_01945, partial [Bacilli bacterium]|nr:hypothetical protein [Bacilli bacterium]
KLEATSDEQELLRRANLRMSTWRSDLVVANSSGSLYTEATPHYIVSQSGAYEAHTNKEETAKALLEQVAACWEERR